MNKEERVKISLKEKMGIDMIESAIQSACTSVFDSVRQAVQPFIPVCFLIRVIVGQLTGNPSEIKEAIKGVILAAVLFLSYSQIISFVFEIRHSSAFIPLLEEFRKSPSPQEIVNEKQKLQDQKEKDEDEEKSVTPRYLRFLLESLISLIFWVLVFFHSIILFFMSAFAPVVFVCGTWLVACVCCLQRR